MRKENTQINKIRNEKGKITIITMGEPRWRQEHSHRLSDLDDSGTLIRSWRQLD
jgi:hypothetical protein